MRFFHQFGLAKFGLAPIAFALAVSPAAAGPITYTFTDAVTGTLGNQAFTNALLTITATGDTSLITTNFVKTLLNPVGHPTFTLAGVGSGTLTDNYQVGNASFFSVAGLADTAGGAELLEEGATAFHTYNLADALGPLVSDTTLGTPGFFPTSLGDLSITAYGSGATFQATLPAPIPEASTTASFGLLLSLGLGGVVIATRRKKQSA